MPLVPEPKDRNGRRQPTERIGDDNPTINMDEDIETPQDPEKQPGLPTGMLLTVLHLIPTYLQLSQGHIEDLTGLLSELSGTPITIEMTSKWLDFEPLVPEIPH